METTRTDTIKRGNPPLPRRAFKVINPVIMFLLRTPLHRLLSHNFIVLTFKGRKTGTMISTPVGYTPKGNSLVVFTFSNWWKNLQANPEVQVRLRGRDVRGRATLVTEPRQVAEAVNLLLDVRGDEMGRRLGFQRIPDHASVEEIREKSQNLYFFQIDF